MKKTTIRKIVEWLQSNDAGFIYALAGVIGQGVHVYFAIYTFSPIKSDVWRPLESLVIAFFFSGLLFFILRAQRVNRSKMNKDQYYEQKNENRKYRAYTHGFAWFDSFVNLHYYGYILWYAPYMAGESIEWYKIIMAVPFSFALPWMLTMYAGEIHEEEKEKEQQHIVTREPMKTQTHSVLTQKDASPGLNPLDEVFPDNSSGKEYLIKEPVKRKKNTFTFLTNDGKEIKGEDGKGLFTNK